MSVIAALALAVTGAPAMAKKGKPAPAPAPSMACSQTYGVVVSGAIGCAGLFSGNIFGGSQDKVDLQNLGLASLGSGLTVVSGGNLSGNLISFGNLDKAESLVDKNTIDFGQTLFGRTIVGAHFGNVAGPMQNISVLWLFDFGTKGETGIRLNNSQGFSNAVLYDTGLAVPEPATWVMMILAFGAVGGAMRRRTRLLRASVA